MEYLLGFCLVIFCLVSAFVMPWLNRRKMALLQEEINQLHKKMQQVLDGLTLAQKEWAFKGPLTKPSTHTWAQKPNVRDIVKSCG